MKVFVFALSFFLMAVATPAGAQPASGPPPDAKEAMRLGLEAAKEENWKAAIEHFAAARENAPYHPSILFNMALAHDRIGGRELVAIVWYRAFLAAAPKAKNAERVNARISELLKMTRAKAVKLFSLLKKTAAQLPDKKYHATWINDVSNVATAYAILGDYEKAMAEIAKIENEKVLNEDYKRIDIESALYSIAIAQAKNGDFDEAISTADKIRPYSLHKFSAHHYIANAYVDAGEIPKALELTDNIFPQYLSLDPRHKNQSNKNSALQNQAEAYITIAERLAWGGEIPRAKKALALAKKADSALALEEAAERPLFSLIKAMVAVGELDEAREYQKKIHPGDYAESVKKYIDDPKNAPRPYSIEDEVDDWVKTSENFLVGFYGIYVDLKKFLKTIEENAEKSANKEGINEPKSLKLHMLIFTLRLGISILVDSPSSNYNRTVSHWQARKLKR